MDYRDIDVNSFESLEKTLTLNEETFNLNIFETFSTLLADKVTVVPLKEGGEEESVR